MKRSWFGEGRESNPKAASYTGTPSVAYRRKLEDPDFSTHNTSQLAGPINLRSLRGSQALIPVLMSSPTLRSEVLVRSQTMVGAASGAATLVPVDFVATQADNCRGCYFVDVRNFRVLHINDGSLSALPAPPRSTEFVNGHIRASNPFGSVGARYAPTVALFQLRHYLVLVWSVVSPVGALRWARYSSFTGEWEDLTDSKPIQGNVNRTLGYRIEAKGLFPTRLAGTVTTGSWRIIDSDTLEVTGSVSAVFARQNPQTLTPYFEYDFRVDGDLNPDSWIGIAAIQQPGSVEGGTWMKLAGNAASIPGAIGPFISVDSTLKPDGWREVYGRVSINSLGYFALITHRVPDQTTVRLRAFRVSSNDTRRIGLNFGTVTNYRGGALLHCYSTGLDMYVITVTPDFNAVLLQDKPFQSIISMKGHNYSIHNHHGMVPEMVAHRDRLIGLPTGPRGRWYLAEAGQDGTFNDVKLFDFDVVSGRQTIEAKPLELSPAGTLTPDQYRNRPGTGFREDAHRYLIVGGCSAFGQLFFVNILGQLCQYDQRRRIAPVLFDISMQIPEMDAGTFVTTGDGSDVVGEHDFVLDREDPLPPSEVLDPSYRGMGLMPVKWQDDFVRLTIVSAPEPFPQELIGRSGFYNGSAPGPSSMQHYVLDDGGQPNWTSRLINGEFVKSALPAGSVVAVRRSFGGQRPPSISGTRPVTIKMFEYGGYLYVVVLQSYNRLTQDAMTGTNTQRTGTMDDPIPPSMAYRFSFDAEDNSVTLVSKTQIRSRDGEFLNGSPAIFALDDKSGQLWIVYERAVDSEYPVGSGVLDLDTLGFSDQGPLYVTDRAEFPNIPVGAIRDNRSFFNWGGITFFSPLAGMAYIVSAEPAEFNPEVMKVVVRLTHPFAQPQKLRVRFSFDPLRVGDLRRPRGFEDATPLVGQPEFYASSLEGELHTFYHDVDADMELPFSGNLQYEVWASSGTPPETCQNIPVEVDLYVQGIVSACGLGAQAIKVTVDGVTHEVASVPLSNEGCPECLTLGAQTPGAVKVARGPLTLLRTATLEVCHNTAVGSNPPCEPDTSLDGAVMWLTVANASPQFIVCQADAEPGEIVTFVDCTISNPGGTSVVGFSTCFPEAIP